MILKAGRNWTKFHLEPLLYQKSLFALHGYARRKVLTISKMLALRAA